MSPKVSVIISHANDVNDFRHVLRGYSRQVFDDFEVVVVSDTSKSAKVENLFSEFPNLSIKHVIFDNPDGNWHLYEKLNRGIDASSGDFIIISGDDTIPNKHHVSFYYSQRNENCVLFSTKFDVWRNNNKEVPEELVDRLIESDFWMYNSFDNEKPMDFILLTDEVELRPAGEIWPGDLYPHPNVGMVCPVPFLYWKDKPWPIIWLNNWNNMKLIGSFRDDTPPHKLGIIQCNLAYYKKHIIEINGYDEDYKGAEWTDADIIYRFAQKGLSFRFIPGCATWHIAHGARWNWEVYNRDDIDNMFHAKMNNFKLIRNEGRRIFNVNRG